VLLQPTLLIEIKHLKSGRAVGHPPQVRRVIPANLVLRNIPNGYGMADLLVKVKTSHGNSYTAIVEASRLLAYNDIPPHGFSLSSLAVVKRLIAIEELWVAGAQPTETEEAFWDACFERQYRPNSFLRREAYLSLAAKDEVAKLAAEVEARMDEAAERAKTEAERSNDALFGAMKGLDVTGLDQSDAKLAAELEKALMEDWDYEAVQAPSQPPVQVSGFKRPSASAWTSKKRRAAQQLNLDTKRRRSENVPADAPARTTVSESGPSDVTKPRARKLQSVPTFTLALRPKPKPSRKSSGIGTRRQAAS